MSRFKEVKEIYDYIIEEIIKDKQSWKDFLSFHAKVYKHSFDNAILIYAQRPDATLVTDMQRWNRKVDRKIKRGAKSIAVFDNSKPSIKLNYLFDIKDTYGEVNTIPKVLQLNETLEKSLIENMEVEKLSELIANMTAQAVYQKQGEIFKDFGRDIIDTKFEKMPYEGIEKCFNQTIIDSATYMITKRCTFGSGEALTEPMLSYPNPFAVLTHFNTKPLVLRLGNAVSNISEVVLRDIEKEVKKIIEEQRRVENNESSRTGIQRSRGNTLSKSTNISEQGSGQESIGQVRSNGDDVSEGGTAKQIQPIIIGGDTDGNHAQSEQTGMGEDGATTGTNVKDRANTESPRNISELSSQRNDKSESGGDSTPRNSIQSKININQELPNGGSFSLMNDGEIIEKVLLRGSGFEGGKQRIINFLAEEHTGKQKTDFLQKEYGVGGGSITFSDSLSGFERHDSKGIEIEIYEENRNIKLTWAKVSVGIEALIDNVKYFMQRYKNEKPLIMKKSYQPNLVNIDNKSKDMTHTNYERFEKIAQGVLNGRYSYMKLKADGFMDLVIEKLWNDRISLSHYYTQNGDLMSDPDMELIVDNENSTLMATTFRQDNLGIYQETYQRDGRVNEKLGKELNIFLNDWLKNIERQGHITYEAHYSEDIETEYEEPIFDKKGNEIIYSVDDRKVSKVEISKEKINYNYASADETEQDMEIDSEDIEI